MNAFGSPFLGTYFTFKLRIMYKNDSLHYFPKENKKIRNLKGNFSKGNNFG